MPQQDDHGTLLVVDAANVVGSVPDGWWRDRRGATERLRDHLVGLASAGVDGLDPPVEVVLVVEGRARGTVGVPGVEVVESPAIGDDTVVDLVRDALARPGRPVAVATADRGLRDRVVVLGATVVGPRTVRPV